MFKFVSKFFSKKCFCFFSLLIIINKYGQYGIVSSFKLIYLNA